MVAARRKTLHQCRSVTSRDRLVDRKTKKRQPFLAVFRAHAHAAGCWCAVGSGLGPRRPSLFVPGQLEHLPCGAAALSAVQLAQTTPLPPPPMPAAQVLKTMALRLLNAIAAAGQWETLARSRHSPKPRSRRCRRTPGPPTSIYGTRASWCVSHAAPCWSQGRALRFSAETMFCPPRRLRHNSTRRRPLRRWPRRLRPRA